MEIGDKRWGRKLIDKWVIEGVDVGEIIQIVPVMHKDKNGNVWSLKPDKSEIVRWNR